MSVNITDKDFDQKVIKAEKPVLVDFWAVWCGPCKMQDPILDDLEKDLGDKGVIAKLNVDENAQSAQKYGVMSIPTLMLFNKGKIVKQWIGVQPKEELMEEFKKHFV